MTEALAEISLAGLADAPLARKRAVAERIDAELRRLGFFVVSDHGVPPALIDEAIATATAFFDLPLAEKMRIRSTAQGSPRGYLDYGLETLAHTRGEASPPDLKEGFGMGPLTVNTERAVIEGIAATYTPNVWPERPPEFRDTITRYYRAMEGLTQRLMELFAIGMDLPPDFFAERFADHNSTLRLIHYPPPERPPEPGQLRAGAHTDYGALTILLGQDRPGGLQVRTPSGEWTEVRTRPHAFVVNIGDLMMTWSNDRWLSNMHRVANPPPEAREASRRLSIAYFCNPNDALWIECLPTCHGPGNPPHHAPIRAGEHRFRKIEMSKAALRAAGKT